ncbi:MAG: FAD:protein FMN transferase [Clostridiales bacterium]|nr:FAD:protein FMN transferase [Clostridiales bacterium]
MISVISTRTLNSHNELRAKPVLSLIQRRGRAFAVSCLILLSTLCGAVSGCSSKLPSKSVTIFALDTYVTLTAEGKEAEKAVAEGAAFLTEMEGKLSRQIGSSEIAKLNQSSEENPVCLSEETYALLQTVCLYAEKTEGLFDPTIAPVMDLWGFGEDPHVPSSSEIEETIQRVDYRRIHLLSDSYAYVEEGTAVDLGGAAKGAIGVMLMERMKEFSVTRIILDLGGNICAWAKNEELTIGVVSPLDPAKLCCVYTLSKDEEMSVITSGAYERYFEEAGVRYGHIMDTSTGYPADTDLLSATVIGSDGTVGDILSTALFASGSERARKLASYLRIDCILCSENGTLWVSSSLEGKVREQEGWTIEYFG